MYFFPSKEGLTNVLLLAIDQYIKSIPTIESADSSQSLLKTLAVLLNSDTS